MKKRLKGTLDHSKKLTSKGFQKGIIMYIINCKLYRVQFMNDVLKLITVVNINIVFIKNVEHKNMSDNRFAFKSNSVADTLKGICLLI